jgi:pyruvate,orthophosphate dikinase
MAQDTLLLLQTLRLKGRVSDQMIDEMSARPGGTIRPSLDELISADLVDSGAGGFRLTKIGRERLSAMLAEERKGVDSAVIGALYQQFTDFNSAVKALIAKWQMIDPQTVNDHSDPARDAAVVGELFALHRRLGPLLREIAGCAPRLDRYETRLNEAIGRIERGHHEFVARPLIDSYHTVWFEFHQELIDLTGTTREQEAKAGRAQ